MEAGNEHDHLSDHMIEQPVGEATGECATGLPVDDRICLRLRENPLDGRSQLLEELLPESLTRPLVPAVCLLDVGCGGGPELVRAHRDGERSRATNSSQAMPTPGPSDSRSSNRWSSSRRWASVSGRASGSWPRISQSWSRSSSCSSRLNRLMSTAPSGMPGSLSYLEVLRYSPP